MDIKYYARTEEEANIDSRIKGMMRKNATPPQTALYLQNQIIINLLRRIDDKLDVRKENENDCK